MLSSFTIDFNTLRRNRPLSVLNACNHFLLCRNFIFQRILFLIIFFFSISVLQIIQFRIKRLQTSFIRCAFNRCGQARMNLILGHLIQMLGAICNKCFRSFLFLRRSADAHHVNIRVECLLLPFFKRRRQHHYHCIPIGVGNPKSHIIRGN